MTSVERVFEYTELPPEAALDSDERHRPPPGWPQHGVISADDVSFRYTADAPLVLRHLRFCVRAKEKVQKRSFFFIVFFFHFFFFF